MKDCFSKINLGKSENSYSGLSVLNRDNKSLRFLQNQNKWTEEEKSLLRRNYNTDIKKLQKMFPDRTKNAIITRICMLKKEDLTKGSVDNSLNEIKLLFKNRKIISNEIHRQKNSLEQLKDGLESINKKLLNIGIEI